MVMLKAHAQRWGSVLVLFLLLSCGNGSGNHAADPVEAFVFTIDPGLLTTAEQVIDGDRRVMAIQDDEGTRATFVENEILFYPQNPGDLERFLAATGGVVLSSDEIPPPPPQLTQHRYDPEAAAATFYLIRIDPDTTPDYPTQEAVGRWFEGIGVGGEFVLSSETAARFAGYTAKQLADGFNVSLNYTFTGTAPLLNATSENNGYNPFINHPFQSPGSGSNLVGAWQYISARADIQGFLGVAILDGGFWVDENGVQESFNLSGLSDFPLTVWDENGPHLIQYDFTNDRYVASGVNPSKCTGGSACDWHGHMSAGVATAILDNGFGGAGSGGLVSYPLFFRLQLTSDQIERAVRTATAWGASVISMSFSGSCDKSCQEFLRKNNYFWTFYDAYDSGVILVASAGNDNIHVHHNSVMPCTIGGVICVGATDNHRPVAKGYSNYGEGVHIWAPSDIPTTPDPDTWPGMNVGTGTSASAPYVAGVAAMIKAIDPDLDSLQVRQLLIDSGFRPAVSDPPDSKIGVCLNAKEAVLQAGNYRLPADAREPNNTPAAATAIPLPNDEMQRVEDLTIDSRQDLDYFRIELTDYSVLEVTLDFLSNLGEIKVELIPPAGVVQPVGVALNRTATQLELRAAALSPGIYSVVVSNPLAPTAYHLAVRAVPVSLQPDYLEPNNNPPAATPNRLGMHALTLHHVPGYRDVDFFRYDIPATSPLEFKTFRFDVLQQEMVLQVHMTDDVGAVINPETITEPITGVLYIDIRSPAAELGRYVVQAGYQVDPGILGKPFEKYGDVWWLNPHDPISILVGKNELVYVFEKFMVSEVVGIGDNLMLQLIDMEGEVLGEGVMAGDLIDVADSIQTLSLEQAVEGEWYAIVVKQTITAQGLVSGTLEIR
ncbi:S8/S53 family peptidase [Desulfurivibrio sp. D14AmB]|uniref:S8/S53 family peptidase n=1 Tax=Desulfurivibrio sp. D14AmB TaxID=3374370 RepID=UPI00376F3F34